MIAESLSVRPRSTRPFPELPHSADSLDSSRIEFNTLRIRKKNIWVRNFFGTGYNLSGGRSVKINKIWGRRFDRAIYRPEQNSCISNYCHNGIVDC